MNRSLSFEKKVQTTQYEPMMAATSVDDIPEHLWKDPKFMDDLSKLLIVQTYKILISERAVVDSMKDSDLSPLEFLKSQEEELLSNLVGITLHTEVTKE